jgi:hypothetical protein
MPSLTQMKKKQLIEEVKKVGIKDEQSVAKMKRTELIEVIRNFKKPTVAADVNEQVKPTVKVIPMMGDEGWTDYVLSLLRENEMQDGNPTLFGLRRIAQKLIGPIVSCRTEVKQIPNPQNNFTSTVIVAVTFRHKQLEGIVYDPSWYGAADVSALNCMEEYAKHPTATAESRAEGRALRKALGINVHTVDEVGLDPVDTSDDGPILNINLSAFLAYMGIDDRALDELTVKEGIQALSKLQEFSNEPDTIPQEMKND